MARAYLTEAELERADVWLDAIEAGATTTSAIAEETGLTRRRIQQRVAYARDRRDHGERRANRKHLSRFDYPFMELLATTPPEGHEHPWLTMGGVYGSEDAGTFNVGGSVRNINGGPPAEQARGRKSYKPDPKLKGGTG